MLGSQPRNPTPQLSHDAAPTTAAKPRSAALSTCVCMYACVRVYTCLGCTPPQSATTNHHSRTWRVGLGAASAPRHNAHQLVRVAVRGLRGGPLSDERAAGVALAGVVAAQRPACAGARAGGEYVCVGGWRGCRAGEERGKPARHWQTHIFAHVCACLCVCVCMCVRAGEVGC